MVTEFSAQKALTVPPYLMYDAIEDDRVRPTLLQWNGKVIPVDDAFWKQYFPPNGWNFNPGTHRKSAILQILLERENKLLRLSYMLHIRQA